MTATNNNPASPSNFVKAGERIVMHNFPGMITNCIAAATTEKRKEFIDALLSGIQYEIEAARAAPAPQAGSAEPKLTLTIGQAQAIAKVIAGRVAKNADVAPELCFAPAYFALQDAFNVATPAITLKGESVAAPVTQAVSDPWHEAVKDVCTVACIGWSDDPKATIDNLITWHVQVALDPSVSDQAVSSDAVQGILNAKPLDADFAKVLHDNLDELYSTDEPTQAVSSDAGERWPWPELDSLADLPHALNTPDDWDADYRATWQKLQVASRNNTQWREYARKLRAALTAHAGAQTAIAGLGRMTDDEGGYVELQFKDEDSAQAFMHGYSPTVDVRDMPPMRDDAAGAQDQVVREAVLPTNDEVYAEVCRQRGKLNFYVSTNAVNDVMAAIRSIKSTAPAAPAKLTDDQMIAIIDRPGFAWENLNPAEQSNLLASIREIAAKRGDL